MGLSKESSNVLTRFGIEKTPLEDRNDGTTMNGSSRCLSLTSRKKNNNNMDKRRKQYLILIDIIARFAVGNMEILITIKIALKCVIITASGKTRCVAKLMNLIRCRFLTLQSTPSS